MSSIFSMPHLYLWDLKTVERLHIYGRGKQTTKENKEREVSYKLSRIETTMQNGANMYASPCVLDNSIQNISVIFISKTLDY